MNFQNESLTDRIIRVVLGMTLFIVAYNYFSGILAAISYILGIILLLTGVTGFCALYKVFGIKTNRKEED